MAKKAKKAKKANGVGDATDKTIELRAGYIVLGTPSGTGGHTYRQKEISPPDNRIRNRKRSWKTTKITDNVEACKAVDAVRQRGGYLLRKYCMDTEIGYFLPPENYDAFVAGAKELAAAADAVNELARKLGSSRRVYWRPVPAPLQLATPAVAENIAYTVRTRLAEMRDLVRAGVVGSVLDSKLAINQNLPKCGIGFAETVIADAIKEIKAARTRIKAKVRASQDPEAAGRQEKLLAVKAAISWFSPVTERTESDEIPAPKPVEAEADVPDEMDAI